jgi:hypothetical protein
MMLTGLPLDTDKVLEVEKELQNVTEESARELINLERLI